MYKGAAAGTVFSTLAGLALFLFPAFFLHVFTSEPDVLAIGTGAVRVMVLMYPLLGMQTVSIVFFQAIGKGMPALLLSILRQFLLYIPFIFLLPPIFGLPGIWMATPLADLLAFFVTLIVVAREFKILEIPLFFGSSFVRKMRPFLPSKK